MKRIKPATDLFEARRSSARKLLQAGRLDDALVAFRQACALNPSSAEACLEIMPVLERRQRFEEAAAFGERAVRLQPGIATAHAWLGNMQVKLRKYPEALGSLRRALLLDPSLTRIHEVIAFVLSKLGLLEESRESLKRALSAHPTLSNAHSFALFLAAFSPDVDAEQLLTEAKDWSRRHAEPLLARRLPHAHERSPERRLRVGYVSPDFRDHVLRFIVTPVLRCHDRSKFEVVCYSSVMHPDAWTGRLRELADEWHDVASVPHRELAQKIRDDGIDVLVDLTMHMGSSRLQVFAERPAPVQIAWFAYPGTTGVDGIGYRITDPYLDPPGGPLPYSERSLWLPHSFWCYEQESEDPGVNELPALSAGAITFGSLNNFLKVNRAVLALWARVLVAVPSSRFLLLAPKGEARRFATEVFQSGGVAPERLEFVDAQAHRDYLGTYRRIDVALDCFPYNGHTTSLDAFWMGVPVVTLVGSTVAGRAGLSQAHNLKVPELVARSPDEFVAIAAQLAADLRSLSELRGELRGRLKASPVMDAPAFTRDLEGAFREAWRRFCAEPVETEA